MSDFLSPKASRPEPNWPQTLPCARIYPEPNLKKKWGQPEVDCSLDVIRFKKSDEL